MKLVRVRPQLEPAVRELASDYEASGLPRFSDILDDYPAAVVRLAANERGEADPHAGVPSTCLSGTRR